MAAAIILLILFLLTVVLLIPVQVKAHYGDGKWAVHVQYLFIRLFHKESEPPKIPKVPPKPGDPDPPFSQTAAEASRKEEEAAKAEESAKPAKTDLKKPEPEKTESVPAPDDLPELSDAEPEEHPPAGEDADQPDEKPAKPKKKGFIERLKPHSLSDWKGLIQDGGAALSPTVKFFFRHLHFRHVKLWMAVASDDAAQTAQTYGKICAAVYPLIGTVQSLVDFQADEIRILADFYGSKTDFKASLELRVSPLAALVTVLILGVKFLWRTVCRFRREDKDEKRYQKESTPAVTP